MSKIFKSIYGKLIVWFLAVSLIPLITSSIISYNISSTELINNEQKSALGLVTSKAQGMDEWLDRRMAEIELAAKTDILKSGDIARITTYLKQIKDQSDVYDDMVFATADGITKAGIVDGSVGKDVNDRSYFHKGMQGESSYSEILKSKSTGNRILVVSAPVKDDTGKVVGVLFAPVNFEAMVKAFLGSQGSDESQSEGTEIMLVDAQNYLQIGPSQESIGKSVKEANLGEALTTMLEKGSKETGTATYSQNGAEYLLAYAPVKETGFGLYMSIPMDHILAGANTVRWNTIIITGIAAVLVVLVALYISGSIAKPIRAVTGHVKRVADGDLTGETINVKSKDEIGELVGYVNTMTTNLRTLIHQVSTASHQVAASSEQLTASAEEASKATEQISTSIQQIASGAEQQATTANESQQAVTRMSDEFLEISSLIRKVTQLSDDTVTSSTNGNQVITKSVEQMKQIEEKTNATSRMVNELGNKSTEIENIIAVITNIASQTNLLALNAAIEAARVGEQGRGFAVVADEVRKLAEQSGQAADQIRDIIQEIQKVIQISIVSMREGSQVVQEGTQLAEQAGNSFEQIFQAVTVVYTQLQEASGAIVNLKRETDNMVVSVETVKTISHHFAGSAQEVAAGAEEQNASIEEVAASSQALAKMAEGLQESIQSFKL